MIEDLTSVEFAARSQSELTILLYHGVTEAASEGIENDAGKHITASRFAAEMRTIKRHCAVLAIDEVVALTEQGRPFPPRAVVVSFDDGFANNYTTAAPILEELQVPAVFYVTSGLVGTDRMFWVDQIEDCLNLTSAREIVVVLDEPRTWRLDTREQKIAAVDAIKEYCKRTTSDTKDRVLADLVTATGVTPSVDHADNYHAISWPQLRAIAASPLFTVGGHSLYHDVLAALPPARMRRDVQQSIDLLARELGAPIVHYSYPEGQPHHYDERVIQTLKDRGIVCCPSAVPGLNPPGTDLFHLRRVMVGFRGCAFPFEHLAVS